MFHISLLALQLGSKRSETWECCTLNTHTLAQVLYVNPRAYNNNHDEVTNIFGIKLQNIWTAKYTSCSIITIAGSEKRESLLWQRIAHLRQRADVILSVVARSGKKSKRKKN